MKPYIGQTMAECGCHRELDCVAADCCLAAREGVNEPSATRQIFAWSIIAILAALAATVVFAGVFA